MIGRRTDSHILTPANRCIFCDRQFSHERVIGKCPKRPPSEVIAAAIDQQHSEPASAETQNYRLAICEGCEFYKVDRGLTVPVCVLLDCPPCQKNDPQQKKAARLVLRWGRHIASGSAKCLLAPSNDKWRAAP